MTDNWEIENPKTKFWKSNVSSQIKINEGIFPLLRFAKDFIGQRWSKTQSD